MEGGGVSLKRTATTSKLLKLKIKLKWGLMYKDIIFPWIGSTWPLLVVEVVVITVEVVDVVVVTVVEEDVAMVTVVVTVVAILLRVRTSFFYEFASNGKWKFSECSLKF